MRKIIVLSFITLDGVMQAPGGPEEDTSGGFKFGGWTFPYFDDVSGKLMVDQMKEPFNLLLGRKTFEIWESYWPHHVEEWPGINSSICESTLKYWRTTEEKLDKFLAWQRDDKSFFAGGACHILAHMFLELHHGEGYELIYIKPKGNFGGSHLYASNGVWAFDFNGWTLEKDLLETTVKDYTQKFPEWDYERIVLKEGLVEFLKNTNTHRSPEYFPYLPWERAYSYIKTFDNKPPDK